MIKYLFKDDAVLTFKNAAKADAQKIGIALENIRKEYGTLDPVPVWKTARDDERNVLHNHFNWDVHEAAEAHWTEQARDIIRCIRVIDLDTSSGTSRAFVSLPSGDGKRLYHTARDIKRSADLQDAYLKSAEKDLEAFEKRYQEIREVCCLIREAKEIIKKKRGRRTHEERVST